MQRYPKRIVFTIEPGTLLVLSICLLLIPIKCFVAWIVAASMHELAHIAVLQLFKVKIYKVKIGVLGAQIQTEPLPNRIEFISSCAGPFCGIFLSSLGRWIPRIAICALFQTICNLIPYKNHDGGRMLRCLLRIKFNEMQCNQVLSVIGHLCRICGLLIVLWIGFHLGRDVAIYILLLYLFRRIIRVKIPCKQSIEIVQ